MKKTDKKKVVIPKGYHKMSDGKIMKDSAHKKVKSSVIPKAQMGVEKTKDSTAYFKKSADINAKVARTAAKYGDRNLSEKAMKDSYEDTRSMLRQTRKGQPGYDKNGYPVKKMGGAVKRK